MALIAVAAFAVGIGSGTFVAGGSDSYCYVHQAERWASGRLQVPNPLALQAPWPDAALTFAPAGHVPSQRVPGAIVPICPPGLSMAMAAFLRVGGRDAVFFVVPLFGALLLAATYTLGARYGARVGLGAALLTACSPVFLYQLVQPMSDVPAAALWVLALAAATGTGRRHALIAGLATSGAILVRPNLVPLGFAIGLFLACRPERTWIQRLRSARTYAAASAVGCVLVGLIQYRFYGSPLASGYGSLDALFSVRHIVPNAQRYWSWLWHTHTPAVALVLLAPLCVPGALTSLLGVVVGFNAALYLPYVVFEDWSFLRFMLPSIPLLMILLAATLDAAWRRFEFRRRSNVAHEATATAARRERQLQPSTAAAAAGSLIFALAVAALGFVLIREAEARGAFALKRYEARFATTGAFVANRLPSNALIITSWQSGSVRLYGGRPSLVWDQLDSAWLDRAIAFVRGRGYEPYLLFEGREEPVFRRRFGNSPVAALDWPPMAEVAGQVRIYRPGDRERYLRGENVVTEYVIAR